MAMRRWPWITLVAAAIAIASPFGQDLFYLAFLSGEQLSRNIAQPFAYAAIAILIVLGAVEYFLTRYIRRRRSRQTAR
jgi:hypothetical protein